MKVEAHTVLVIPSLKRMKSMLPSLCSQSGKSDKMRRSADVWESALL